MYVLQNTFSLKPLGQDFSFGSKSFAFGQFTVYVRNKNYL
jgi:hypothetical protein